VSQPNQTADRLKVPLCMREYSPEVYGGAGVHVEYMANELSHVDLTRALPQGSDRPTAVAHRPWDHLKNANPALQQTISTGLSMVAAMGNVDLVHSHTWYANMAAHLTSLLYGIPHPQLGGRLERGSPLALGYLDVRHDGITAELKVERKTPVTRESAPKYIGQPTQYAADDGAQLSILAILDMSSKQLPVGTPENYLFALERKKTPVHDTPGQKSQSV
jgi:hypothetical protein